MQAHLTPLLQELYTHKGPWRLKQLMLTAVKFRTYTVEPLTVKGTMLAQVRYGAKR